MIDSSGTWSFQQGMQPVIASSPVKSLAIGPGEINAIDLLAIHSKGYVAVNGQFVATLDLPASDARGDFAVGPPFLPRISGVASLPRTTDSQSDPWIEP
jgi:hypothetical protein